MKRSAAVAFATRHYTVKNVRTLMDILWCVFDILTELVLYAFVSAPQIDGITNVGPGFIIPSIYG